MLKQHKYGHQQSEYSIINASVVTPDRIFNPGGIRIESGVIVDIWQGTIGDKSRNGHDTINAHGCLLLPGFVDIHADSLEMAIAPRPAAPFKPDTILPTYDAELAMHGITTVFHCVGLADLGDLSKPLRKREVATEIIKAIRTYTSHACLRTRIHLRYEITDTLSLSLINQLVENRLVDLVSIMDHTPGYGVFKDIASYRDYFKRSGHSMDAADNRIEEMLDLRKQVHEPSIKTLVETCHQHGLIVVSHDDHTEEKLQWAFDLGVRVAEFPVTMEAVHFARSHGMQTVFGTPNLIRGTSHAGNLSVRDLIAADQVDILCLDYSPMCSLLALFKVAQITGASLCQVSRLLSLNPARSAGMDSVTGSVETGKAADLILIQNVRATPRVLATFIKGLPAYQSIAMQ
jgi:alpha-D-ribose 1-methylphosphonate 5-triphosphate diphosphatase